MLAIGLRSRYLLTTASVTLVVTAVSISLYSQFLKQERLSLIDQQVRETATALVDSDLADLRLINFDQADEIISDELGESRIGKFFIIRDDNGDTIFESTSAKLLPIAEVPQQEKWFQIVTKGKFIRGLNLKLPRIPNRTLQVGVMLDESLVRPGVFSQASMTLFAVITLIGLFASTLLTSFLLKPIAQLSEFLKEVAKPSYYQSQLPPVPEEIALHSKFSKRDEFVALIENFNILISRVNKNYQLSRLWAYQMAHELKTPLTVAMIETERLSAKYKITDSDLSHLLREISGINDTVNAFLGWAELENSSKHKHLYFNRMASVVEHAVLRLADDKHRIRTHFEADPVLTASRHHVEQLISNLIQNALIHGKFDGVVTIKVAADSILILDQGQGLMPEVNARLGEPFNKGEMQKDGGDRRGHGLGLAWVVSICKLYGWELTFERVAENHAAILKFTAEEELPLANA